MEWGTKYTPFAMVFFFIGHIMYILSIPVAHKLETEKDVPMSLQPRTRKILAWALGAFIVISTTTAVYIVAVTSKEYAFCSGAEVYAQLFTTALAVGMMKWRRGISMFLTCFGALTYSSSDICVAIERYVVYRWWMPIVVMVTYWGAVLSYAVSFFPIFFYHSGKKVKSQ